MTISGTYTPVLLTGDGSQDDFDFDYQIFNATDLVVNLIDSATLVATLQTYGVDYTVAISTSLPGGTVTFITPPTNGTLVSVMLAVPITQPADIPAGGLFREKLIEEALDRVIVICQQLSELMSRAVVQDVTQSGGITMPVPVSGEYIRFNDDGDGLVSSDLELTTTDYDGTITHGTAASKAASPEQGDLHFATDTGAIYGCKVAGVWTELNATPAAASTTVSGIVELATSAEIDTGTDNTRAITPDGLAGAVAGERCLIVKVFDDSDVLATGDGKKRWRIPSTLNGMNLISVAGHVYTASSSGAVSVQINNETDSHDMLSTNLTIDANETDTLTAAAAPVVNASYDDVATGDILRFDCDGAGTGTCGLELDLVFRRP